MQARVVQVKHDTRTADPRTADAAWRTLDGVEQYLLRIWPITTTS
jgi:hypothetical protein